MLESIIEQTDTVVQATEILLGAMTEQAIPGAVISRMQGEKTSGDPGDLVEAMAESKLRWLVLQVEEKMKEAKVDFTSIMANLGEIAGERVFFTYMGSGSLSLQWGNIAIASGGQCQIDDIEKAMYFLANYDLIEKRFLGIFEQLVAIKSE